MKTTLLDQVKTVARQRLGGYVGQSPVGKRLLTWWNHYRTDVYLLSYPKCGRTWLRLMMGKALVDEMRLACVNPMELGDLHRHAPSIPRIRVTHDDNPQVKRSEEVERDKTRYAGKRVVYLVRDPRDVVVSYYFQASKRRDRFAGDIHEFLRHPVGSLDTIITYYNVWAENRTVPSYFHLVRYEDLHRDAAAELARVLEVIGHRPSRQIIEAATEYSRFDNMRKLEQADAFKSKRLKPSDEGDIDSFKTRKGRVKGYRDYFTADEIDYMNGRIAGRLSPFYADYLRAD